MWPDDVDEILDSDQVVALAYCTPADGVVLTPLTNFSLRDRQAGKLTAVNSSVGVYRKLERIRANPRIALAYHTRTHGFSDRPEYVLVQGTATLRPAVEHYPKAIQSTWERFGGPVDIGPLWNWWLRVYNLRIPIEIAVHRVIVWPDVACHGTPQIHGAPITAPEPQREPKNGTGPRIDHRKAAKRASRLENVLLGWVGADGFPIAIPARPTTTTDTGVELEVPKGLVPNGGRRAGLLAHEFARYTAGQNLRKHTGWLQAAEPGVTTVTYAPHTEAGYHMPSSMTIYRLAAGAGTRRGLKGARRAGFVPASLVSERWTPSSSSGS